jgi:hypothetical protein
MDIALWIVTGILAAAVLAAGSVKAFVPKDKLATSLAWTEDSSAGTVRFIGISEILGAIGLVLPWLTGIAPILTPLAAVGLAIIQALAIPVHLRRGEQKVVPVNIVLLLLALFVAIGRSIQLLTAA